MIPAVTASLTAAQARRIMLAAQGFGRRPDSTATMRQLQQVLNRAEKILHRKWLLQPVNAAALQQGLVTGFHRVTSRKNRPGGR